MRSGSPIRATTRAPDSASSSEALETISTVETPILRSSTRSQLDGLAGRPALLERRDRRERLVATGVAAAQQRVGDRHGHQLGEAQLARAGMPLGEQVERRG